MATATTVATAVDPLVAGRTVPSLDRTALAGVDGAAVADLGLAPRLMAHASLHALRRGADGSAPDPALFTRAGELFATGAPGGESVEEYEDALSRATGLTVSTAARCRLGLAREMAELGETVRAELPPPAPASGREVRWVPAGRVFAAIMASNHPMPNISWVQALYHGYSVAVRPGSRDPFTARRLVRALIEAGLPADRVAFLPCQHAVADTLVAQADRAIVYGGQDAVEKWRANACVAARGPGRSKALLDGPYSDAAVDHLALSASFDGGTRCNNLSAVLTDAPVAQVADALARRLARIAPAPLSQPGAILPGIDRERAQALGRQLDALGRGLTDHSAPLTAGERFAQGRGDALVARPLVLSTDDPGHPAVGLELPFPFVVVAPWRPESGVGPLRDSLVANLFTASEGLVEAALREPTIRKVVRGAALPWAAGPGVPHDGNYTQFLLEPKGLISVT